MIPPPSATPLSHSRPEWGLRSTPSHGSLIPFPFHLCCGVPCIVGRLGSHLFQNRPSDHIFELICPLALFARESLGCQAGYDAIVLAFLALGSTSDPGYKVDLQLQGVRSHLAPHESGVPRVISTPPTLKVRVADIGMLRTWWLRRRSRAYSLHPAQT